MRSVDVAYSLIAAVAPGTVAVLLAEVLVGLHTPGWLVTVLALLATVVASVVAFERAHRMAVAHHGRHTTHTHTTTGGTDV